jgi:hypothetical protein
VLTSWGINARSTGANGGAVTVDTLGSTVSGAQGILATTTGTDAGDSVTVNVQPTVLNGGSVTGTVGVGISTSAVNGATTITNGVAVKGATDGIVATSSTGTGTITVNANANVTGVAGRGIVTNSGNATATAGAINIAAGTTVTGLGDATVALGGTTVASTHAVIDVTTASGGTTTITNNGIVTSETAGAAAYADLAVLGTGGNVVLNNKAGGLLRGRVNTSGVTAANATTITNAGTWHTTGTSTLGGGADTLTNSGLLLTAAGGAATTIDFGAGGDKLTNSGTFVVGEAPAAASTVTLANLETFNNSGTIIFGSAATVNDTNGTLSTSVSDNQINDRLITGAAFAGSGASLLRMDANLWSDTQTDCTSLTAADCLQIGSSSGSTSILINDTNAHALGAFNPTGIAIVKGSSAASTFSLNSGSEWFNAGGTAQFGGATNVLDKPGLFFYSLAFDSATNRELLIGVPKAAAFELAALGGASSDVWYTTTQSWFDRQADLRDTVSGRATGGAPGVWLKVVGDWTRRKGTDNFTLFNQTFSFNTGYNRDTAAIIGGIDFLNVTNKDQAWVLGVQGGYVDSNVRFRATPDRANLTGTVLGVYGTYLNGGLFVDGIVNANFLSLDISLPGLQTTPSPWTATGDVRNWGGQLEAGYSMPIGSTAFWEPVGSIAYGRTSTDDLSIPGGTQTFGDTDSWRGSLGARIGTTAAYQYYRIKLALEGRVWDEWDGKTNTALIVPGGPNFNNLDKIEGVFGELKGEANLFSVGNNLSAFLNGGIKWKSRYQSTTLTLGVRYQW